MTGLSRSRPTLATWKRRFRWPLIGAGILAVLVVGLRVVGGALVRRAVVDKLSARLGRAVTVGGIHLGLAGVTIDDLEVPGPAPGRPALARVRRVTAPVGLALGGGGTVSVVGARFDIRQGGEQDNVTDVLDRLKGGSSTAGARAAPRPLPRLVFTECSLEIDSVPHGVRGGVPRFDGELAPGQSVRVTLSKPAGSMHGGLRDISLGAESLTVTAALDGLRPRGLPEVTIAGGYASPLPKLDLSGVSGNVKPDGATPGRLLVDMRGSWGGAKETLWTASGVVEPLARQGQITLRAARFSLARVADILPKSVLDPAGTTLDAELGLKFADDAVDFDGRVGVAGLALQHDALGAEPLRDLGLGLVLRGRAWPARRRVELTSAEAQMRSLVGRVQGSLELAPGAFTFADGTQLRSLPRIDLTLEVPKVPCKQLLASIPRPLIPRLDGFDLGGFFEAKIGVKIDYANLDALELTGKVGIDGCRVLGVAPAMNGATLAGSFEHHVEVPVASGSPGDVETIAFIVGPENPDFVPFAELSPFLIASVTTTEDGGFFKHRGWVTSEFKTALRRNLERGGFRLGASSITMQTVKNVFLSQEKTLSRKLQELFLVWYLEQVVTKERIMEMYFNAIEFGPRLYGIGAACRHYFGKRASELTPLEAAFISSILPSPKRRYVHYCNGALNPAWDKYVRRILTRVHERGRITDDEFAASIGAPLVFDRAEALPTKECLAWVKKMTSRPVEKADDVPDDDL